jgi:hypothetical protein
MNTLNTHEDSATRLQIDAVYESLSERCVILNELLWQAPVVSLTAQAFLLTIAYGETPRTLYRILAGLIATVIGFASWQLFLRHLAYERAISRELRAMEETHFGRAFHAPLAHSSSSTENQSPRELPSQTRRRSWIARCRYPSTPTRHRRATNTRLITLLAHEPHPILTLTFDNGVEFHGYKRMELHGQNRGWQTSTRCPAATWRSWHQAIAYSCTVLRSTDPSAPTDFEKIRLRDC